MVVVSAFTKSEPKEQLYKFYTLLDTPVGKEQRLRDLNIEIKLEGQSESKRKRPLKKSRLEKYLSDDVDDGLLLVDLLSLRKKFSWARYRTDILGFIAAAGIAF